MKKYTIKLVPIFLTLGLFFFSIAAIAKKKAKEYYQITVYSYTSADQEKMIDQYLQQALLPALHRAGIMQVGVFKAIANDTGSNKKMYVLLPMKSLDMVTAVAAKLSKDEVYKNEGAAYLKTPYTNPPYQRMETILLQAFAMAPPLQQPALKAPKNERVYELRSYESATEEIFKNKVHMFNEGDEIGLFKRLNFNAVFYGSVLAGSKMPNLMYMTSFENMADRDAHWKTFVADPQWKQLSSMPEYQKNVSHIDITFLRPTNYSDF